MKYSDRLTAASFESDDGAEVDRPRSWRKNSLRHRRTSAPNPLWAIATRDAIRRYRPTFSVGAHLSTILPRSEAKEPPPPLDPTQSQVGSYLSATTG